MMGATSGDEAGDEAQMTVTVIEKECTGRMDGRGASFGQCVRVRMGRKERGKMRVGCW